MEGAFEGTVTRHYDFAKLATRGSERFRGSTPAFHLISRYWARSQSKDHNREQFLDTIRFGSCDCCDRQIRVKFEEKREGPALVEHGGRLIDGAGQRTPKQTSNKCLLNAIL